MHRLYRYKEHWLGILNRKHRIHCYITKYQESRHYQQCYALKDLTKQPSLYFKNDLWFNQKLFQFSKSGAVLD